jgi:hypothetical protein
VIKTIKEFKKLIKNNETNLSLAINNITIKPVPSKHEGKQIVIEKYQTNHFNVVSHSKNISRLI